MLKIIFDMSLKIANLTLKLYHPVANELIDKLDTDTVDRHGIIISIRLQ